ncbi:MAG: MDR family MFS transporter, partial [Maricaulaceae bacterium]
MTDAASPARDSRSPADVTPQEKRLTFIALMIVFLLAALDMTIIATAMPRIVADLEGLDLYPWVTTIYLLTSTVMVPIWGKLGDLFGRKIILISGVCIFVVGSWLCGLSGEFGDLPLLGGGMMQLIIFRGLQGIGGGALFTSAFGVIADMFPPRERAKYAGLFGAVFGVSSILGPLIGGYFTDHGSVTIAGAYIAGWRWVFYVNLPTSVLALAMIFFKMPDIRHRDGGKIDILGGALVIIGIGALLLALSWGGRDYGWASPMILSLFAFSAIVTAAFVFVESKFSEPILPLELFKIRSFSTTNVAAAIMGMAFMGTIVYLPLYLQLGLGVTATTSGLSMLPLMLGLTASAAFFGRMVRQTGFYRRYILVGCAVLAIGLFLLAQLGPGAALWQVNWRLVVVGIGLGPSQSLFTIIVQNSAPPKQLG